jgi:hypothetical protein
VVVASGTNDRPDHWNPLDRSSRPSDHAHATLLAIDPDSEARWAVTLLEP